MNTKKTKAEILQEMKEKLERQKIESKRRDLAYYERLTSGFWWKMFKVAMISCILFATLTTIDQFFSRKIRYLSRNEWKFDRSLYIFGTQSVWVDGTIFFPDIDQIAGFDENSFAIRKSLIFNEPRALYFKQKHYKTGEIIEQRVTHQYRSIFNWFPYLQFVMLIPLLVYVFRRPSPWFIFFRGLSIFIIFPCILTLFFYACT